MGRSRVLPVVEGRPGPGIGRRGVLRGLLGGAGAGFAVPALAASHPFAEHAHHPGRIAGARAKALEAGAPAEFLDSYQMKMVDSLGERIVPGAAAAGCAPFIDRLLAVGDREDRQWFLTALGAIDAEARSRFGVAWSELSAPQRDEILGAAATSRPGKVEEAWTPGTSVAAYLEKAGDREKKTPPATLRDHFDLLKGWVVGAYYSSETGQRELGYTGPAFADSFPGCPHPGGHRRD
jgi:hypothetical protein